MPEVKARKTIFIKATLDAAGKFTRNIEIPFDAHDMIVRSWSAGTATNSSVFTVNMGGIGDIFHFASQEHDSPRHVFKVNGPLAGAVDFTIHDIDNLIETGLTTELVFCLEFLQYYPQKIEM
jgi:hypothetical protein